MAETFELMKDFYLTSPPYCRTLIILSLIMLIVFVAYIVYSLYHTEINGMTAGSIMGILLITMILAGGFSVYTEELERERETAKNEEYWNSINEKAETYRIMLDGVEVKREDVDLTLYRVTYDDETKTIFMTKK
jgi:hypothetical protein